MRSDTHALLSLATLHRMHTAICRMALAAASATQMDVSAVAVHGTGTPLGDPIEVGALGQGLKRAAGDSGSILVLSNKACYGHTEGTAGLSGAERWQSGTFIMPIL